MCVAIECILTETHSCSDTPCQHTFAQRRVCCYCCGYSQIPRSHLWRLPDVCDYMGGSGALLPLYQLHTALVILLWLCSQHSHCSTSCSRTENTIELLLQVTPEGKYLVKGAARIQVDAMPLPDGTEAVAVNYFRQNTHYLESPVSPLPPSP